MTAAIHADAEQAAAVIRGAERAEDFLTALRVCLYGGDELLAILDSIGDHDELEGFARVLQKHLGRPARR
jgi:hypothetical protein